MRRIGTWTGKSLMAITVVGLAFGAAALVAPTQAEAAGWGVSFNFGSPIYSHHGGSHCGHGVQYGYGYTGPIYHPPSVHSDYIYHHEGYHWTPGWGLHSHGHYDAVPHYVPGHFDFHHGHHVHPNPHFHH